MYLLRNLFTALLLVSTPIHVYGAQIVDAADCYMRIQIPRNGQSTNDARISTSSWTQSVQQVTNTIKDYSNLENMNVQLWLQGGMASYLYMGFYVSSCQPITAQPGLNAPGNALTVILPSGVAKLQKVYADSSQLNDQQNRATAGIFGISGTLGPQDYAYATGQSIIDAITGWSQQFNRYGYRQDGQSGFGAVRGDGEQVIVVADLLN